MGDPTEGALLALAGKAGLQQEALQSRWPRMGEFPFSSERKRMSVMVAVPATTDLPNLPAAAQVAPFLLITKGSPELVLSCCRSVQQESGSQALTPALRQQILQANDAMASRGLRVLGLAYRPLSQVPPAASETEIEKDLLWLGLVGMLDAPRPEVRAAVDKCWAAGIRTIMITGDHQLTAAVIAQNLNINPPGGQVLTGQILDQLSQAELEEKVEQVSVFARVSPEHKLRIVKALQKRNCFVAMTGDGVNDAPALKQADIGIAMGITGTDVSKEASDMVLLDDNFATIVAATEEGRVVYSNIRHFIKYILGSNIGEVITIAAAPIIGLSGVPLTPLQILWMNLVTDGLPALALAVEPGDPNMMNRPPFSPKESIFARGLGSYIIRIGIIFAVITISLMVWSYHSAINSGAPDCWKTMVFTTLCIAQMGHAIAVRSNTRLTIEMNPLGNPYLWGAVIITTILQLMLIYVEPLRNFFETDLLTPQQLLICLGFSSLMFLWVEMEKVVIRLYHRFRSHHQP
jgi:Ca2+-transporting ATPase